MPTAVIWTCRNCEGNPEFGQKEFVAHCKSVHGLKPGDQIALTATIFLDGRGYAERHYDGECNGLKFSKVETDRRWSR